ncbi:putative odorant-binding protein A10 isoform X1 [Eurosta solidaginis]|uniref:putative odorant-binding protein A10 isoform X1 n=1 Tax=Eurosta solidaginis TaxID=178769 RepID=UPI003530CC3C
MLRSIVTFLLLSILFELAVAVPHPSTTPATAPSVSSQGTYDTRFDNIDLDEVLSQERLLRNYIKCLENTGPCTPDSKMLKEILPDAISTDCAKCSTKQKSGSAKVTHFLIDNRPEDWVRLEQIYDPQGNYRLAYLAEKQQANGNKNKNDDGTEMKAK